LERGYDVGAIRESPLQRMSTGDIDPGLERGYDGGATGGRPFCRHNGGISGHGTPFPYGDGDISRNIEMMEEKIPNSDMDGGWKDIIENFTEEFFSFFLPEMHAAIDFTQGVKFLDRELSEIVSDSDNIRREADRLLEVHLKDGGAECTPRSR